jgi:hypothetical protein
MESEGIFFCVVEGHFYWGFLSFWVFGDGEIVVNLWWIDGETWWVEGTFLGAEKFSFFEDLFLGNPVSISWQGRAAMLAAGL